MLDVARSRAAAAGVTAEFDLGDAQALAFPDATFDACRSERTFQWLADPAVALAEMVRVTRPGGRVAVIDSDWDTFSIDHPDDVLTRRIFGFLHAHRPQQTVGRRLGRLFRAAGLEDVSVVARAALFTEWDPDTQLGPPGLMPIALFVGSMVEAGVVTADEGARWVTQTMDMARHGDLCGSLTLYAACGRKPA
jgi:SAM-dependent methyltransferase